MMINKESKIIYEPSYVIKDKRLLTTLCILYDEVLLFNDKPIDKELLSLEELKFNGKAESDIDEKIDYINGPLKLLNSEGALGYYTSENVNNVFPESNETEINLSIKELDGKIYIQAEKNINRLTANLLNCMREQKIKIKEFRRLINLYSVSDVYKIPILSTSDKQIILDNKGYIDLLANSLAVKSVFQLALPEMITYDTEEILNAREILKDELIEFKAGILDLSYMLHQILNNNNNLIKINSECEILVNTKVKAAVDLLENKIKKSKNKRIKNLILTGSKILLSGGNLLSLGVGGKELIENGIGFLDSLKGISELERPEHKIATYVLKARKQFHGNNAGFI